MNHCLINTVILDCQKGGIAFKEQQVLASPHLLRLMVLLIVKVCIVEPMHQLIWWVNTQPLKKELSREVFVLNGVVIPANGNKT